MAVYDGVIRDNVVVLPDGMRLPDGTPVEVRPRVAGTRDDDDSAAVDAELRADGLLDEPLDDLDADAAATDRDDFEPVPFTGRPLSEQIIEERRCGSPRDPVVPVHVRPFASADRDAVLGLAPRLIIGIAPWRDAAAFLTAARGWIERSIAGIGPDQAVLVAEDTQGQCMGFVSVSRQRHFTGAEQAYIGELVVAEEAEGQGVGRALVAGAEAWGRAQDYRLIALETGMANRHARDFYERLGYNEESVTLVKVL